MAKGKGQQYAPLPTDGEEGGDEINQQQPTTKSSHKLSGHDATGKTEVHWSGLSGEEARNFRKCPSDRVVFPEYDVSFLCWVTYQWLTPLMKLGNRCHLQDSDVWAIHEKESCTTNGPRMHELWRREQRSAATGGREPSVIWPIFYTTRRQMGIASAWKLLADSFKLANPFIMRQVYIHWSLAGAPLHLCGLLPPPGLSVR
jgi:ATP-binding cassette subfamily C (CFTR/MRP) protein 1